MLNNEDRDRIIYGISERLDGIERTLVKILEELARQSQLNERIRDHDDTLYDKVSGVCVRLNRVATTQEACQEQHKEERARLPVWIQIILSTILGYGAAIVTWAKMTGE